MCRKLTYLIPFVLVLVLAGNTLGDTFTWDNSSGDSLWRNPENWDLNRLPDASETEGDGIYIDWLRDPTEAIIDADTQARCWSVTISNDSVSGQDFVHLHMTGGTLLAGNLIRIGREETGMFTLDDGDVTCGALQLGRKDPSKGLLYINGGTITVSTNTRIPRGGSQGSELHLNGGTLYTDGIVMNDPEDPLSGTNGRMDISGGVLVLTSEEDKTEQITEYVNNGWITAFGVTSGELTTDGRLALIQMDYNVTNPGMTTVWATTIEAIRARTPKPENGATVDLLEAASLGWTAGETAVQHDVYFGNNFEDVNSADTTDDTGIYRGHQDTNIYNLPEALELGATHYWRIDEVEADDTIQTGPVWSFTIADFLLVDDCEDYTEYPPDRIYDIWIDGYGIPTNGSTIGHESLRYISTTSRTYAETEIVHSGAQSMPYYYDNSSAGNSEATMTLSALLDWTMNDVDTLTLWFRGNPKDFIEEPEGTYTINASGEDIWGTSDEFRFVYKQLSGPGSITAKVESVEETDLWAKAGVMIRQMPDAGSKFAAVYLTPSNGCRFQGRLLPATEAVSDSDVATEEELAITAPYWIKLERAEDQQFNGYYSSDGVNWVAMAWNPQTIAMPSDVYIGLAVTSHNPNTPCEAKFSNVQIAGTVSPEEWTVEAFGVEMPSNDAESVYVVLDDSATSYHEDAGASQIDAWTEWNIDLQEFADQGVDLTDVHSIGIGFGDRDNPQSGGSGLVYFDDIRLYPSPLEPEPETIVNIQWLGHSTVKVWTEDCVVYVDPERVNESLHDATLVCVTHSHGDHYSPSDIARVSNPDTQFVAPPDVVQQYGSGQSIAPGQTIEFDDISIIAVHAYNINTSYHARARNWVGFIIEIGSKRIYVAGDTDLTDEMKALEDIDVAILPVGGTYTMNATQAAEATQYIQPELAIPYHWGQNVGNRNDAQRFADLAHCAVKILEVGETISSENWSE